MLIYCPECGTKLVRVDNVAEKHDDLKCPRCGFTEPIDDECHGGACSFYG